MGEKRVDVRGLVSHLGEAARALRAHTILAPTVPGGRVRTRLEGLIYTFRALGERTGWGHFRPLDERTAIYLDEPSPWEREAYLALFPALRVMLLWPQTGSGAQGAWLAVPANAGEARQRFGWSMDTLPIYLCDPTDGADRFETVLAHVDGRTLWYGGPDLRADPTHAAWLRDAARLPELPDRYPRGLPGAARQALLLDHLRQIEQAAHQEAAHELAELRAAFGLPRDGQARRDAGHREQAVGFLDVAMSLEQRLRRALARADAELHSFSEAPAHDGEPAHLVVEWSRQGQRYRYRSVVAKNLTVIASGICLSGRDDDFDLTSLVSVMADAD
jgi:hypothetical protein